MATKTFSRADNKFSEVVLGIVSPVGTDLAKTIDALSGSFSAKGYKVYHIKVSNTIRDMAGAAGYAGLDSTTRFKKVSSYISYGNLLRENFGNAFLSAMVIAQIAHHRINKSGEDKSFSSKVYIVDQLKTVEELDLLREVYGSAFFQISVYSARDVRVDNLSKIMAHDVKRGDRNPFRKDAEALVVRDEDESDVPNGQKVGKIFQLADVVINADKIDENNSVQKQIERFTELLFGSNSYSPNRLEYGMFVAYAAALRSLDLSRQVGAAIFRETGEIAALGTNEVPKAGGGTYWTDDKFDAREFKLEVDSNDGRKEELMNEVVEILLGPNPNIGETKRKLLEKSQFMDALEYGRIIHAEMSALSDAARLGISVNGGTLYCTTFPCHMCSKHVVAAGIRKVVFLEPYPKSLTADLHSDSVKIEGSSRGIYDPFPAVEYIPFFGITPRRYRELFTRAKRKKGGKFEEFQGGEPQPIFATLAPWYAVRENEVIELTKQSLSEFLKDGSREADAANQSGE
ncbi:dCMP deaminase [Mesorhizobium sp. B2-2-2]|uniref:anti-phage dCTP deaminase n=1 Tax=Mesorhizobium sp. B2-2-2 TaxID=2589964 RepID=UPI00112A5D40|nr:anti-phage dCTP deaminase [Mesorhizobium sp. B2-2-2]TPM33747.1 dCMP deaminase [Mesorhizobium sp. B2-2-2]